MRETLLITTAMALLVATAATLGQGYERVEEGVADADPLSIGLRELEIDLRTPNGFNDVYKVPGRDDLLMRADGGLFAVFPRSVYVQSRAGLTPVIPNNTTFYIGETSLEGLAPPADAGAFAARVGAHRRGARIDRRLALLPLRSDVLGLRPSAASRRVPEREGVTVPDDPVPTADSPPVAEVEQRPGVFARGFPARPETRTTSSDAGAHEGVEDEAAYRSRRIRELMRRAAVAAQAARGPSSS